MKVQSVYFGEDPHWQRMADVYRASLQANRRAHAVTEIYPHSLKEREEGVCANHYKFDVWEDLRAVNYGPIIFTDADMICMRDPSGAFDKVEHIGITIRDILCASSVPFNAGVIYTQDTPEARRFMTEWAHIDAQMFQKEGLHHAYRKRYGGMNQASLRCLLERNEWARELVTWLPCSTWNNVEPWIGWEDAAFVHIKGYMRDVIFKGSPPQNEAQKTLAEYWHEMESKI